MSMAEAATKIRLEVEGDVAAQLDGQSRICNWLYNHLLERANNLRAQYRHTQDPEIGGLLYSKRGLRNLLPQIKEENPFIKVVHSSPLKNAALRVSDSIRRHQDARHGRRKGGPVGWPRFRSWRHSGWFSLLYDEPNKGFRIHGEQLTLSLGKDRNNQQRYVVVRAPGVQKALKGKTVNNLRIVKQQGVFYAVFGVDRPVPKPKEINHAIVLDPNHKNLAYGVDSEGNAVSIETPWWLKILDRRADELQAKRDRCCKHSVRVPVLDADAQETGRHYWRPSKRWMRYDKALQRVLAKRREQSKTYLATVANRLYRHYDWVVIGDYTPKGNGITTAMRRAMSNRSVIGQFKDTLSWTALKSGKQFSVFQEHRTTRTCSECGHAVEGGIAPGVDEWDCPCCGAHHLRDENAARNGWAVFLREQKQNNGGFQPPVPRSGPAAVRQRWTWRVRPSGIYSRGSGWACDA
ncbi:RNA-guided endonuclease InsQ/TnpB family protein [Halorhodospira halophila]|uniref:RNA-guided endonuclease InsQ/TnpB family protein n=1 Tax=Halorhodospira halophila TaxID=1053 RepID=UPI001912E329|nr:RNA-guided endonuclease TnpB family protein [Halorhodospira halophila]